MILNSENKKEDAKIINNHLLNILLILASAVPLVYRVERRRCASYYATDAG